MMVLLLIIAACVIALASGNLIEKQVFSPKPQPTQQFRHNIVLDPNQIVHLYWEFNETHITFEVHAQTTGWVGIGISPSGSMVNADMYVGWVKNGMAYITDRHGIPSVNMFPPFDAQQNLELLEGRECDGWTLIKFRRQLAACDTDHDKEITSDTIRLVYAYGPSDPVDDDITPADYHGGQNRGSKSVLLLDQSMPSSNNPAGETYETLELLNDNINVPPIDTYYNCKLFKLPEFPTKQHLVKVEPIIQEGHELNVHHILVFQCAASVTNTSAIGRSSQCYTPNVPPDFLSCRFVLLGWAIGGGTINFPPHAGLPLGTDDSPKYVILEIHYDNPNLRAGDLGARLSAGDIVDSSGLRLTYTSNLRQYDVGILQVGHGVTGFHQIIPPNVESFLNSGECTEQCLGKALDQANTQEINAFAILLHSHLLGKELTLKHVRNATELPPLAEDRSYDFNFQETRHLPRERVIRKGDTLQMICNYNSKSRKNITLGGLKTTMEMCLGYVHYYPKLSVTKCETIPDFMPLMNYFGIEKIRFLKSLTPYSTLDDVLVLAPQRYANKTCAQVLNSIDWDETKGNAFSEAARMTNKLQICKTPSGKRLGSNRSYPALRINATFTTERRNCTAPSHDLRMSNAAGLCRSVTTASILDQDQSRLILSKPNPGVRDNASATVATSQKTTSGVQSSSSAFVHVIGVLFASLLVS